MLSTYGIVLRHHRSVMAAWIAIVMIAVPFALRESDHLTAGGFVAPGSQSSRAEAIMAQQFPTLNRASLGVLIWPKARATAREITRAIERLRYAVHNVAGVHLSQRPLDFALFAAGLVGPVVIPLTLHADSGRAQDIADLLHSRLGLNAPKAGRVETHLLGESGLAAGLQHTFSHELSSAEEVGLPILFAVLLVAFGSFSAAILPIVLGAVAVTISGALIYTVSLFTEMSVFVTNTASMLGVGIAIDYSLIILGRARQELRVGHDLGTACDLALRSSGRAVIFSGVAVMTSLMGLWFVPIGALHSMAVGAMLVVAVSVLLAVTLLPALIVTLGASRLAASNTFGNAAARLWRRRCAGHRSLSWDRWTEAVMRHPLICIGATGGMLLLVCCPVLTMQTGTGTLHQLGPKSETRRGYIEAAKLGGVGALGPVDVTISLHRPLVDTARSQLVQHLRNISRSLPDVHEVGSAVLSHDGDDAYFSVIPSVDPESNAGEHLVQRLRVALAATLKGSDISSAVGGTSATQLDLKHDVARSMWKVIVAVMALMFVVLSVLLRSVLLALKAVAMSLLSVAAAYGVLVIVFQWGWTDALTKYHALGYLDTLTLPLILAIVVGLSMDYEVFLLCRIKEEWCAGEDSSLAVSAGLKASASTISTAAFVLVCVFAVFIGTGIPSVKELGLGVAAAIFIDATMIRLILVPAAMRLLGDWSWWWPAPFDRILPSKRAIPLSQRRSDDTSYA